MDIPNVNASILDQIPTIAPPPGVVPNFINPPLRKTGTRVTIYVSISVTVIFLVLRLYTRVRTSRKYGADDALAVISVVCCTAYCGTVLWMLDGPLGIHEWDVPVSHQTQAFIYATLAGQIIYSVTSVFVKAALLILYLRIFNPSFRARGMIWAGIIFIVPFYIAIVIAQIKQYIPLEPSHHMSITLLTITSIQGIGGIATDFYILFIPMQFVCRLRLPLGRKIGVCSIFATGLAGCICSIVNTVCRFQARGSDDTGWETIPQFIVGILELNIGIMCSCMPVIFVLFKSMTKNKHYLAAVRYFRSRRSKPSCEKVENQHQDKQQQLQGNQQCAAEVQFPEKELPTIPQPAMTGIRSYIRNFRLSRTQITTLPTHRDINSLGSTSDGDYHSQLKALR